MKPEHQKRLDEAQQFVKDKNYDEALRLINKTLDEDPDNSLALYMLGFVLVEQERFGMARVILHRALELERSQPGIWYAYGQTFQEGHDLKQAESAFRKSMALEPNNYMNYSQIGLLYNVQGKPKKAIPFFEKALKLGGGPEVKYNLGIAKLLLRQWAWKEFEEFLGRSKDRKERVYCSPPEPRWDGSKGKVIVAYGEQGIGDEITLASCLPDLIRDSKKVIIETERRLVGLFKRSFPEADVYGTRFKDDVDWLDKYPIDARVAFGSLPKFYRNSDQEFPGTSYLIADPERRIQWRALLHALGDKPKIGLSWTGGTKATGKERRSLRLEQLLPILKADATFISLEYREEAKEEIESFEKLYGIKIHHWDRAVVSDKNFDYDETAALVSELDMVIGVTTASLHLSGALGIKTLALVPEWPTWLWGIKGNSIPWSQTIKLYRQKGPWESVIARVGHDLKNIYRNGSTATVSPFRPSAIDHSKGLESKLYDYAVGLSADSKNLPAARADGF